MLNPRAVVVHLENQTPIQQDRFIQIHRSFFDFAAEYYPLSKQFGIRLATVLATFPKWLLTRDRKQRTLYKQTMLLAISNRTALRASKNLP